MCLRDFFELEYPNEDGFQDFAHIIILTMIGKFEDELQLKMSIINFKCNPVSAQMLNFCLETVSTWSRRTWLTRRTAQDIQKINSGLWLQAFSIDTVSFWGAKDFTCLGGEGWMLFPHSFYSLNTHIRMLDWNFLPKERETTSQGEFSCCLTPTWLSTHLFHRGKNIQ